MPQPLTRLERRILDYLVDYLRRNTYQPSIREIGERFDIKSTKTVSEYLQALADKGWIERDPSRSRGVRLLGVNLRPDVVSVPCYAFASSALAGAAGSRPEEYDLDRKLAGENGSFFVRMHGDSMEAAGLLDGDLVLIEAVPEDSLVPGDVVAVRLAGDLTIKRYYRRQSEVVLEPASPKYAPTLVAPGTPFSVLGRATAVFRRFMANGAGAADAADDGR